MFAILSSLFDSLQVFFCQVYMFLGHQFSRASKSSQLLWYRPKARLPAVPSTICAPAAQRNFTTFDGSKASSDIASESPHIRVLLENNRKWVQDKNEKDASFFKNLANGQKPKYLYFGCSDSRVPANEILGLGYGRLFTTFVVMV